METELAKIETVSFYEDRLICPILNYEPFVIVNQVIELIGLFPQRAMLDLRNNPRLSKWIFLFSIKKDQNSKTDVPIWVCQFDKNGEKSQFFVQIDTQTEAFFENLKGYSYAVLPVRKFTAWLYGISPERVKPEIRPNLERYQDFCDEILFEYFLAPLQNAKICWGKRFN